MKQKRKQEQKKENASKKEYFDLLFQNRLERKILMQAEDKRIMKKWGQVLHLLFFCFIISLLGLGAFFLQMYIGQNPMFALIMSFMIVSSATFSFEAVAKAWAGEKKTK